MRGWIVAGAAAVVGLLGVAGLMLVAPSEGEAETTPAAVSAAGATTPLGERMAAVARAERELTRAEARAAAAAQAPPLASGGGSVQAAPVEQVAGAVGRVVEDAWDDDDGDRDDDRRERDDDDHGDDDHDDRDDD